MSTKDIIDSLLRLLEIIISWPVIVLIVIIAARKELVALIIKLADRMTRAPGGFEFAALQDRVQQISTQIDRLEKAAFEPSQALTPKLQSDLQTAFDGYQAYLIGIGYKPAAQGHISIFVDPSLENASYDGQRIVIGNSLASDADALFREITHRALQGNVAWGDFTPQEQAVESGLADYFPCSYRDNPLFGEKLVKVFRKYPGYEKKPALRIMNNNRKFTEAAADPEEHNIGEIWSGAFWEIRDRLGKSAADKLLYSTWTGMQPFKGKSFNTSFPAEMVRAARTLLDEDRSSEIATVFRKRRFELSA